MTPGWLSLFRAAVANNHVTVEHVSGVSFKNHILQLIDENAELRRDLEKQKTAFEITSRAAERRGNRIAILEATIERVKNVARYDIYVGNTDEDGYADVMMQQEEEGRYLMYTDVEGALLPVRET